MCHSFKGFKTYRRHRIQKGLYFKIPTHLTSDLQKRLFHYHSRIISEHTTVKIDSAGNLLGMLTKPINMKLRHKFAATVISGVLAGISLGIWGALILHNEIHHGDYEKIISRSVLAGVFLFGLVLLGFAIAFRRSFFRIINDLGSFTDQLGSGGVPEPMVLPKDGDVSRLYALLNYLRDRQQTLAAKLADGIERESSLRQEIEFFNAVLVGALKKLLNESGQNLSMKGKQDSLLIVIMIRILPFTHKCELQKLQKS